jgi:hypothetical protein
MRGRVLLPELAWAGTFGEDFHLRLQRMIRDDGDGLERMVR